MKPGYCWIITHDKEDSLAKIDIDSSTSWQQKYAPETQPYIAQRGWYVEAQFEGD